MPLLQIARNIIAKTWKMSLDAAKNLPRLSPLTAVMIVFFYGVILIILSYTFRLSYVCGTNGGCTIKKEVGYLYALNWSFNSILVLPCIVFFLLEALHAIPETLRGLSSRNMLVNGTFNPINVDIAVSDWNRTLDEALKSKLVALLFLIALCEPIVEWFLTSVWPLLTGNLEATAEKEYDWAVAALLRIPHGGFWARGINMLFSLLVFAMQSVMIAAFAFLLTLTYLFSTFFNERRENWRIVPSATDADTRKGFQLFEEPIIHLVAAALLILGMFYFSKLQNAYLRTTYPTIASFVRDDIIAGAKALGSSVDPSSLLNQVPSKPKGDPENFSGFMVLMGGFVVIVFVLGMPLWILRGVAMRGKNILEATSNHVLGNMTFWPLSYMKLNTYIFLCILSAFSLYFYRLGLFIFGLLFSVVIMRCIKVAAKTAKR